MRPETIDADIAIVGSGFSGALTAMALRRLGRSVVMIERGRHPRFAIGESSTPLANLLIEELSDRYDLPRIRPLSKWGTWQAAYPGIACGLKRGFSFYRHDPGRAFADDDRHERQLLVAASPHDGIGDTHWYRPDFDHFLVREAEREGVTYLDETVIEEVRVADDGATLQGRRHGTRVSVDAGFVIDASGPRGFLHRALGLNEPPTKWLPPTQGLYTHFTEVASWGSMVECTGAPFPVDAAALHHVFPGGWIWVLRFNNGLTSAGAAVTDDLAREVALQDGEAAWHRLLERLPSVRRQFEHARPALPFVYSRRIAFRSPAAAGPGWAMLPSAVGVIDPLLSTGFPLTLLGVMRLVEIVRLHWRTAQFNAAVDDYGQVCLQELDATERLVAALYASMEDFPLFKRLSLLYFAAATFAETVRRLGDPARANGFLLNRDPVFGPELTACADAALGRPTGADRAALFSRIDNAIAPIDVAGFGDRDRRDWYPVQAHDLLAAGPKIGASPAQLRDLLERCGFEASRC